MVMERIEEINQILIGKSFLIVCCTLLFMSCSLVNNKIRYDGIYIQKGNFKRERLSYIKLNENDSFSHGILPRNSNYLNKENIINEKFELKGVYKIKEDSIFLKYKVVNNFGLINYNIYGKIRPFGRVKIKWTDDYGLLPKNYKMILRFKKFN